MKKNETYTGAKTYQSDFDSVAKQPKADIVSGKGMITQMKKPGNKANANSAPRQRNAKRFFDDAKDRKVIS